jgi:hypothetical protein
MLAARDSNHDGVAGNRIHVMIAHSLNVVVVG